MFDRQILAEVQEIPDAVARQEQDSRTLTALAARLAAAMPQVVVTCARGSSAHAATFAKHLIERYLGVPVAPAAPNIATVYRRPLQLNGQLFLAISQSGGSDDLIEQAASARSAGAITVCIVNNVESPLARACEIVLPMAAGPELSVAATKTFVNSLAAVTRLVAEWTGNDDMRSALQRLPSRLRSASALDWSQAVPAWATASSLVTIGRGPTLAVAREAALKLKEICDLPAEAFSSAEFMHGPIALVTARYPALVFMPNDEAADGLRLLSKDLQGKGAAVFVTGAVQPASALPALPADHPESDAICLMPSFYTFAVKLAQARGLDVSAPRNLQKVTRTR